MKLSIVSAVALVSSVLASPIAPLKARNYQSVAPVAPAPSLPIPVLPSLPIPGIPSLPIPGIPSLPIPPVAVQPSLPIPLPIPSIPIPGTPSLGQGDTCAISPDRVAAFGPVLTRLGLEATVDGVKELVRNVKEGVSTLITSDGVFRIVDAIDGLITNLGLGGLELKPTLYQVAYILRVPVECLVNLVLPIP
ncbi:hypothetical protein GGI12_004794 [Dipsacomyces acuminosporus]|nr:hypothetical protein GGI12_004794 [Dipsacomyces acuminosporus]